MKCALEKYDTPTLMITHVITTSKKIRYFCVKQQRHGRYHTSTCTYRYLVLPVVITSSTRQFGTCPGVAKGSWMLQCSLTNTIGSIVSSPMF